ncbi:MAG TPA: hypothetical protein VK993_05345 [Chthoniobacterales bacterium]|nr:hypothetical protein [Chthoniobacterales bacterium]
MVKTNTLSSHGSKIVVVLSYLHDRTSFTADRLFKELTVPVSVHGKISVILSGSSDTRIVRRHTGDRHRLLADYTAHVLSPTGRSASLLSKSWGSGEIGTGRNTRWRLTDADPWRGIYELKPNEAIVPLEFGAYLADFSAGVGNYEIVALEADAAASAVNSYWRSALSDIPADPNEQEVQLRALLSSLDTVYNPKVLSLWLKGIAEGRVVLPAGVLPDSLAVAIVRRLLTLSFSTAVNAIEPMIRSSDTLPFRKGYFQISLTGAILARLAQGNSLNNLRVAWLNSEIDRLKASVPSDDSTSNSLLAALLAIRILVEEDTEERAHKLDSELQSILERLSTEKDRRFFLQFLADSLSRVITSATSLVKHLQQVLVFFKYARDSKAVLWPRRGVLGLLQELFFPSAVKFLSS